MGVEAMRTALIVLLLLAGYLAGFLAGGFVLVGFLLRLSRPPRPIRRGRMRTLGGANVISFDRLRPPRPPGSPPLPFHDDTEWSPPDAA